MFYQPLADRSTENLSFLTTEEEERPEESDTTLPSKMIISTRLERQMCGWDVSWWSGSKENYTHLSELSRIKYYLKTIGGVTCGVEWFFVIYF